MTIEYKPSAVNGSSDEDAYESLRNEEKAVLRAKEWICDNTDYYKRIENGGLPYDFESPFSIEIVRHDGEEYYRIIFAYLTEDAGKILAYGVDANCATMDCVNYGYLQ